MRTNQKVRNIIRSQDSPFPEPGTLWIYKKGNNKYVLRCWENGEWHDITGCDCNGGGDSTPSEHTEILIKDEILLEYRAYSEVTTPVTTSQSWTAQIID